MNNEVSQDRLALLQAYQQLHLLALRAALSGLNDLQHMQVMREKEAASYLVNASRRGELCSINQ